MSQLSAEDEAELQTLLRQLLRGVKERISGAPSIECAEEILLHLEETDKNFHNYEFVKYLRQYVESSLGAVSEEETEKCARGDGHATGSGQDTLVHAVTRRVRESPEYDQMMQSLKNAMMVVVESLIDRFEEDLLKKEEMQQLMEGGQPHDRSNSHYTDNCSDSDSSFNQSYAFIKQEQLQVLAEKLDPSRPKEVRWEALQALCFAPPSDVLSCESWSGLRRNLAVALADPDPDLSDKVLPFFARTFSSSPLSVTREIYSSLAKSIETNFLHLKISLPIGSAGIDVTRPDTARLLKQMRLMNDFQKEVTTFWIRHPEKYMEEVIESTFSLLSIHSQQDLQVPPATDRPLQPVHLLALLDVRAAWFNKWMHGNYSRTVVFRLLERKYKSLVASALQQCILYQEACERFREDPYSPPPHHTTRGAQKTVYTGRELQYAYFVHSVCVLGKTLMYTKGRNLFPISIRWRKESVGLTDLVVILINIMYQHPKFPNSDAPTHTDSLCPTSLVTGVLRTLSDCTECAVECLYQTPVIETLLAPVIALLNGHQAKFKSLGSRLTHIADTLACIASTDQGLSLFLNERNVSLNQGESTSAAHVIVQFTQKLLGNEVPSLSGLDSSSMASVCGAFIFVCRQMYNTCEGLQALRPYALHSSLAHAWKKVSCLSERALTPVPGAIPESSTQEAHNNVLWEETLLDNLLNFAATPKGLLLLQQTGAIDECVSYMFSRFTKKLQVSRCEKFGYGVMVSQVAATAPGVAALRRSGFVQALVVELWSCLECGREEARVVQPRSTPMEPIDRSCLKSFLSLVTLLSAAQSVWELLGGQPLPNRTDYSLREVPTSIPDLIDRLIAVDSDIKIHSLFNYEQSHTFGLRLLSVLCCNLDSLLLLEAQYDLSSMLLRTQEENILPSSSSSQQREFIVDGLSVERNQVLVRAALIGGPSERRLPPRELQKGEEPYPWPMFSTNPVPAYYSLDLPKTTHSKQDSEISMFLASSYKDPEKEESWMDTCRRQYCKAMTTRPNDLTGPVLADLLEKVVSHLSSSSAGRFFPPSAYQAEEESRRSVSLSSVQQLGVSTCCRYGRYLKLVSEQSEADLSLLLKNCQRFLSKERIPINSKLSSLQGGYPGHDWLVCTVFLLLAGDGERSLDLLLHFSTLLTSAYVWPARIHASVHVPGEVASSGIGPVFWCTAHYVEMLLKSEVPLVSSAFKMSGFTPSQMCLQWLGQCWWNYLDWPEISHYLSTCVVMGADYQVYMCVAVLKHLQPHILRHTQTQDLQVYLKEEPIQGFRVSNYLEYMEGLEQRYRTLVLADMKTITLTIT